MCVDYKYGIRLTALGGVVPAPGDKVLLLLNARNDQDRLKFVDDLREAILEVCRLDIIIFVSFLV